MTVVIACALLATFVLLNWVVLKRSAGLTDLLWIIGGFYLLSFLYNVTMIDELAWEAVDGVWQGGSASGMLGRPSKTLDWLLWLNWMSLLVLITSFFRVDRAADAARGGAELLTYDKDRADVDSRHYHEVFLSYLPQKMVFYGVSYLLFPICH